MITCIENCYFFYENGNGVEQNYSKAFEYYQLATEKGNSTAMLYICFLYEKEKGVKYDYYKAFNYNLASAEKGN